MKKLIIASLLLCFTFGAKAQELNLGVKVGANFANINDAKNVDLSNKTGLTAGVFLGLKYEKFAIQPELLYSQQGGDSDFGGFDLDYINIPVMFKYYIIGNFLNIQAGPQFGFVVNDDFPSANDVGGQIDSNDFDFAAAVGAGLNLPFGLSVDARYNFGLTDISDQTGGKNGVFSIAVGYSFL